LSLCCPQIIINSFQNLPIKERQFNYCCICSNTPFFVIQYFLVIYSSKSFQTGCLFSFPQLLSWCFTFTILPKVRYFLIHLFIKIFSWSVPLSPFCIKPFVSINKQLSIDSSLDWEGHHWDYRSSRHLPQFLPLLHLLQMHLTRYNDKVRTIFYSLYKLTPCPFKMLTLDSTICLICAALNFLKTGS